MAASLEEASFAVIIKELGSVATDTFTCGGYLQTQIKIQLAYEAKTGQWSRITFPTSQKGAEFQHLLDSSKVADEDSHLIDVEKFLCSFQLSDTGILEEIRATLTPESTYIHAELSTMCVYASCTKVCTDKPCGDKAFGFLVVYLPLEFSGGCLVTRHNGQHFSHNWSVNSAQIHWAAFFSDVESEIHPATRGYCVMLSYALYHGSNIASSDFSPFYLNLKAAIDDLYFMLGGGVLGFSCEHEYILERFNEDNPLLWLKGSDRTIFSAAKSLNLDVKLCPIVKVEDIYHDPKIMGTYSLQYIGKKFEVRAKEGMCGTSYAVLDWKDYLKTERLVELSDITWCRSLKKWTPSIFAPYYDYRPICHVGYQSPAILVTIPRQKLRGSSNFGSPKPPIFYKDSCISYDGSQVTSLVFNLPVNISPADVDESVNTKQLHAVRRAGIKRTKHELVDGNRGSVVHTAESAEDDQQQLPCSSESTTDSSAASEPTKSAAVVIETAKSNFVFPEITTAHFKY